MQTLPMQLAHNLHNFMLRVYFLFFWRISDKNVVITNKIESSIMSELIIRPASPEDASLVLDFVKQLAHYEKLSDAAIAEPESIRNALEKKLIEALLLYMGDKPIGFCTYLYTFTTFAGKRKMFVEDIFIDPDCRRKGAATMIFNKLSEIARDNDCARIELQVLDWNESAVDFYERFGAEFVNNWLPYAIDRKVFLEHCE